MIVTDISPADTGLRRAIELRSYDDEIAVENRFSHG